MMTTKNNLISFRNQLLLNDNHDILPGLPDNSVDLILTDPPYKNYQSNRPVVNPKQKKILEEDFDLQFFIQQSHRLLKNGCHFYCFCDHLTFADIKAEVEK